MLSGEYKINNSYYNMSENKIIHSLMVHIYLYYKISALGPV